MHLKTKGIAVKQPISAICVLQYDIGAYNHIEC